MIRKLLETFTIVDVLKLVSGCEIVGNLIKITLDTENIFLKNREEEKYLP